MSQQLVVDGLAFSQQGRSMTGQVPLQSLARLLDQVESADGALTFTLTGRAGAKGEPLLDLTVQGALPLRCQRCLGRLDQMLDLHQVFELRSDAGDDVLGQEDLEDDSRDFIEASRSLDVVSLIEDEVLLGLPLVARHEQCNLPESARNPEAASPFGVLRNLAKPTGKTH